MAKIVKALLKSIKTIAVICLLSIALKMSSVTNKLNVSVECRVPDFHVDVSSIGCAMSGSR